jgi:protein phosphatase type 2C, putative
MDSSGDDLDDNELFYHTIGSHFNVIFKFLVGISINLTSSAHLIQLINFMMKPQVLIWFSTIFGLILFFHSFDFCFDFFHRLLSYQWLKEHRLPYKISSQDNSHVESLKLKNIGIYALKGRRPKMEDTFSYLDESERYGLKMFGVFDGHGGDVSCYLTFF